jgi:hypothetical protein
MARRRSTEDTVVRFVMLAGFSIAGLALLLALVGHVVFDSADVVRLALMVAAVAIAPPLLMLYFALRRTLGPVVLDDAWDQTDEQEWEAMRRRRFWSYRRRMRENPPKPTRSAAPDAP